MAEDDYPDPYAHLRKGKSEDNYPDPYAHLRKPSLSATAFDIAKQIPTGLVAGVAAIPAFPAQAAGFIGGLASPYVEKGVEAIPSWLGGGPAKVAEMRALDEQRRARMAAAQQIQGTPESWGLPKPETTPGQFARTAAEFVPAAVAGSTFSPLRALGIGTTAGLTSEAAGQATAGTAAEPYARISGALVAGTAAGKLAETAATKTAAKSFRQNIKDESDVLYDQFRNSGFKLTPDAAPTIGDSLKRSLAGHGYTDVTAKDTQDALSGWLKTPWTDPKDFQAAYQELGHIAKSAQKPSDRTAANIAQENLLSFLERDGSKFVAQQGVISVGPTGVATPSTAAAAEVFQRANANWAGIKRAERLDQAITRGELKAGSTYSGLNLENELRRRVGVLGLEPEAGGLRGATPAERQAFTQFGQGTPLSNVARYFKGVLGGGGGLGALGTLTAAGGAGAYYGSDPALYGSLAALGGLGLAKYGNLRALQQARDMELRLLSRTPYAAETAVPGVGWGGPRAIAAPTLATIGEPQYTAEGYPYYQGGP
jgi:hypothetical protein